MPNGPRRELSGSWVIPLPCNIFPRCPTTSTLGRARCDRPGSRGTVLGAGGGADRRRFLTERRRWSRPRSGSWRGAQHSLQVRSHRQQQHHRRLRIGVSRRGELQARPPSRSAVFSSASRQQRPGGRGYIAPGRAGLCGLGGNWCAAVDFVEVAGPGFGPIAGLFVETPSFMMPTMRSRSCRMVMASRGSPSMRIMSARNPALTWPSSSGIRMICPPSAVAESSASFGVKPSSSTKCCRSRA
jgi:hypothetical protein